MARQRLLDETEVLRQQDPAALDRDLTVGQLVDRYLDVAKAMKRLASKTLFDYRLYAEHYIKPHLGDIVAHELLARFGTHNGLVHRNPVVDTRPPARTKSNPAHWTPDEARTFLAWHDGDRLYPLWAFMLGTGLRIGELVWLRWSSVDLDARLVQIRDSATALGYELDSAVSASSSGYLG